jgi:hypothetical protein
VFAVLKQGGFAEYVRPGRRTGAEAEESVVRAGGGGTAGGQHRSAAAAAADGAAGMPMGMDPLGMMDRMLP